MTAALPDWLRSFGERSGDVGVLAPSSGHSRKPVLTGAEVGGLKHILSHAAPDAFQRSSLDSYNAALRSRGAGMKRRQFITVLGGAMAWPRLTRAQQPAIPVVGYLSSNAEGTDAKLIRALLASLSEQGFIEGKTVAIEFRWSADGYDRLSGLAAELVARKVDVIVASGLPATLAAEAATPTIPIVFRFAVDPVAYRVVASFDRPADRRDHVVRSAHSEKASTAL
jgi:hypothetical protein